VAGEEHQPGIVGGRTVKRAAASPGELATAAQVTAHCLTGCAIGEVLGMVTGTAAGLANLPTVILSIVLAFACGVPVR
jgi:Domain of unknown function (DUF4396)